jgi:hypothetical protein
MKAKQILKIIIAFILLLSLLGIFFSISFYLIQKYILDIPHVQEYDFWQFALFIIGYGDSPNIDVGIQLMLSILGIIMVSLLSAFLTVNLFKRAKDVFLSKNIIIWKNKDDEYIATIFVGNTGEPIYKVCVDLQLFDQNDELSSLDHINYEKPIIIKEHPWRIDCRINIGSLMYEYLLNKYKKNGSMTLYALVTFVDSNTGQENTICREYKVDSNCKDDRCGGFTYYDSNSLKDIKTIAMKKSEDVENNYDIQNEFLRYIRGNIMKIDMHKAKPIVENGDNNAITIVHDRLPGSEKQTMKVVVDFRKRKNLNPPGFVMALIEYLPPEDWRPYYEKNYCLEFDLSSTPEITLVQLEIKDSSKAKIVDKRLDTCQDNKHFSIKLQEFGKVESWAGVSEICFTVFQQNTKKPKGTFTVTGCELVKE